MSKPVITDDPMYQLLRTGKIDDFNRQRDSVCTDNLRACDYRGLDLRGLNAEGLDFSDAYFRNADLRGIDFRNTNLEGVSLGDARISGCYFPGILTAVEIKMSIELGTRIRYSKSQVK